MSATTPIDEGPGFELLREMMRREGVFQIRFHDDLSDHFTVELKNGRIGGGKTPREAIDDAKAWEIAA